MHEGWDGDDYLILFDESESPAASERYGLARFLPGFTILGLRGWDDFIVRDPSGAVFIVPAVPIDHEYLQPFQAPRNDIRLEPDPERSGKIKWYVQPLIFGGDPSVGENMTWISHDDHAEAVKWWNDKYRELYQSIED